MSTPKLFTRSWRLAPGGERVFQVHARPWLPAGVELASFTPDFTGTPFTGDPAIISEGIVQIRITCASGASGRHVVPVELVDGLGQRDTQAFEIEVR
jgi:hypothetical protein